MNNVMAALAERLVAVWVERIAGSKITTIAGILGIAATSVSQLTTYIPAPYATYVGMLGVIVAGVAAILAKDSSNSGEETATTAASSTQKLGAIMLCMVLASCSFQTGCSAKTAAQDIVNWTPTLQSAVAAVDATASVLAPQGAAIFAAATVGFDAASNVIAAQAKAYLANPNATLLSELQTAVSTFQQSVNAAVLQAAKITDPASQQKALADIGAVGTIVNTILSVIVSVSGKAAVAQMASRSTIKLAQVQPYLNRQYGLSLLQSHYAESLNAAQLQLSAGTQQLQLAGF
jgi:hypothetical protein